MFEATFVTSVEEKGSLIIMLLNPVLVDVEWIPIGWNKEFKFFVGVGCTMRTEWQMESTIDKVLEYVFYIIVNWGIFWNKIKKKLLLKKGYNYSDILINIHSM